MEGATAGVDKAADAKALCCRGLLPMPVPMTVVVVSMVMTLQTRTYDQAVIVILFFRLIQFGLRLPDINLVTLGIRKVGRSSHCRPSAAA